MTSAKTARPRRANCATSALVLPVIGLVRALARHGRSPSASVAWLSEPLRLVASARP